MKSHGLKSDPSRRSIARTIALLAMATAVSFGIRADAQSPTVVRSASPPAAANGAAVSRLAYATFLRGNFGVLTIFGLTILPRAVADSAGNTFVADTLFSEFELPNTNNTQFTWDPFVMKVSADGKSVVFTTDLKGQTVTGLALDPAGNIYVAGQGVSGTSAGFIAKLAPDGSVLYNTPITACPWRLPRMPPAPRTLPARRRRIFKPRRELTRLASDPQNARNPTLQL